MAGSKNPPTSARIAELVKKLGDDHEKLELVANFVEKLARRSPRVHGKRRRSIRSQ